MTRFKNLKFLQKESSRFAETIAHNLCRIYLFVRRKSQRCYVPFCRHM